MSQTTPKSLQPLCELTWEADILSVAANRDQQVCFLGGAHGQIALVELTSEPKIVASWSAHVSYVSCLVLTDDQLISAGSDHRVLWWDRQTHRPLRINEEHPRWVRSLALSPDQLILASVCDDMRCRLWESSTGKLIRELHGHEQRTHKGLASKLYACAFSGDGHHLVTADQIGQMLIWEVASGELLNRIQAPHFFTHDTNGHGYGGIRDVVFSPDGKWIAACGNQAGDTSTIGGSKSLVQLFDWATGTQIHEWTVGGNFFYERLRFVPQRNALLAAGGAGGEQKIVVLDLASKDAHLQEPSPLLVFDLALSDAADRLLTVGRKEGKGHLIQWAWNNPEKEALDEPSTT